MTALRNKRGSITIFLVIIFMAFLILIGLLIDTARIMLAQQQLKVALNSAVRSTMANCHKGMAAEYGIYGGVLQEKEIEGFLAANLKEHQGAFNIIKYDNILVEKEIRETDCLLNNTVFQKQILQYMKYKGPLVLGENLIDKLKGHSFNEKFTVMEYGIKKLIGDYPNTQENPLLDSESTKLKNSLEGFEEIITPVSYEKPDISIDESGNEKILEFIRDNLILKVLPDEDLIENNSFYSVDNLNTYYDIESDLIENEGQKVMSFLASLKQEIEKLACKSRDNLLQTEYVMDKYTYLTSSTMREHYFNKGEIEYILCGNNSELNNLLTIFQRIWFLRFAVNVLEDFYKCQLPHPIAKLAHALTEGFKQACHETAQIYNGKGVSMFPDLPNFQMYYSDYLRMFLLIQENDVQLNRMRQLMQVNIRKEWEEGGFKLADYQSTGKVRARADIDLWFLPARAFSRWAIDSIRNGKLTIEQETVFSY